MGRARSVTVTTMLAAAMLIGASVLAGCAGSSSDAGPSANDATATTASAQVAAETVRDFDPSEPDAMATLNSIAAGPDVVASIAPLLDDADSMRRWAALYVIAIQVTTLEQGSVLEPLLDDKDPATRIVAAGSLVGLGEADAIPVLVDALRESAQFPYSDPPRPLADLALEALTAYTGQDLDGADAWEAWLDNAGELTWNGTTYVPS